MGPKTLRKDTEIFLLGHYSNQIVGNKLPSNKQVLSVLFYNLRQVNLSLAKSLSLVIKETLVFWEKARIPTRQVSKCEQKLKSLYEEWRSLQKTSKKYEKSESKKLKFVENFENLFDIAHANAMDMMTIEEDKMFLLNQRKPGRVGCFGGVDTQTKKREYEAAKQKDTIQQRKRKAEEEMSLLCK